MLNETIEPVPLGERAATVPLESPCVGVAALLDAHEAQGERVTKAFALRELPFRDLVTVRGEPGDAAFAEAFARVVGCAVPAQPNTRVSAAQYDVLWLGPDEWLVRSREAVNAGVLEDALVRALNGMWASAVDVGSGYTVLELSGARVREVLARGCPLDLHPRMFGEGQCAQSFYFKASIMLIPTGAERFEVVVRRSFADYFCRIMLDAAAPLVS
ncbi:sarcosine oxidase subunit gamma [Paraburkholderia sp. Ac-20342]|uniref:sarcosine oxidase subunit gamma n=1 Tax=Paraburkholderia sp. Ac-20342 TaxID=2703889 RepID=UPI001981D5A7|nr:sarcosine oxidase subunit gamma [Paraburkholderia sp. Ac-20342]MBN3846204.1 sarcosine oxidase subunit gamma [Paraburkholderia sp. Ac-20342]